MKSRNDLYDASPSGAHGADHMDIGRGGGAVALQGLAVTARHGEGEGRGGGQQTDPGAQREEAV